MLWMIGLPIGLGVGNFIGAMYAVKADGTRHQTVKLNEITSILWFILAVLIYGVFK